MALDPRTAGTWRWAFALSHKYSRGLLAGVVVAPTLAGLIGAVVVPPSDPTVTDRLTMGIAASAATLVVLLLLASGVALVVASYDQRNELRLLLGRAEASLSTRRLDVVVEIPELDHDWYLSFGDSVAFRVPVYVVNRSRTETVNLRFEVEIDVGNLDPPERVRPVATRTVSGGRLPECLPNPLHLGPQSNLLRPLCLVLELDARRWATDGVVLLSDGLMHVRDEQSGESFSFPIPGRYETVPRQPDSYRS